MAPSRVRIPPSPPRRGGRAVECGGLENRYPSLGGSRVQIPPPPLNQAETRTVERRIGLLPFAARWEGLRRRARLSGCCRGRDSHITIARRSEDLRVRATQR